MTASNLAAELDSTHLAIGGEAPTFYLRDLEGNSFFLSKLIKAGQPILLSFYATWCVPCRQEIPAYEALLREDKFQDVNMLYVHVGEPARLGKPESTADVDLIIKVSKELDMTHTILLDRYAVAAEKYGATSLPTCCIIDGDGRIAYHHTGYKPGDEQQVEAILLRLLP